jgi:hypothetical protein
LNSLNIPGCTVLDRQSRSAEKLFNHLFLLYFSHFSNQTALKGNLKHCMAALLLHGMSDTDIRSAPAISSPRFRRIENFGFPALPTGLPVRVKDAAKVAAQPGQKKITACPPKEFTVQSAKRFLERLTNPPQSLSWCG